MANALSVNHCRVCQTALADNGDQPNVVKCARGHPFHRNCLIASDICLRCPENHCGEQFTFVSKGFADRSVKVVLVATGLIDLYEDSLKFIVENFGVTYEYASALETETDFLKESLKLLPETISRVLLGREGLKLVCAIIAYYGLSYVTDYIKQQLDSDSSSEKQEQVIERLI